MSRLAWVLGVATGLAGCAQLAGIDNTTSGGGGGGGGTGDAGVDADPTGSSITWTRYSIGATVIASPQSLAGTPLPTFDTASGPVQGTITGANAWTLDQPSTSALFDAPANSPVQPNLWQFPNMNLQAFELGLERPGAIVQPPAGETLDIELALPTPVAAGEGFELLDIGAWTVLGLAATQDATTISLPGTPYTSFTGESGNGLVAIAPTDAVVGLRYVNGQLTGASDSPGFTMTGADTFSATMQALPLSQTLNAKVDGPSATSRLAAVQPAFTGTPAVGWSLDAAPGYAFGQTSGVRLTSGTGLPGDATVTAAYSNPFLTTHTWHTAFTWVMDSVRSYTPTAGSLSGLTITALEELATVREPGDGTTQDDASITAGMPQSIKLGTVALTSDGLAVGVDPSTALTVSTIFDLPSNTMFQAEIFESTAVGGALQDNIILTYLGTSSVFTLAPNTLAPGHTYRIRMFAIAGAYDDLAGGDLTKRSLPFSIGVLDSGIFSVGTPQ